MRKKVILFWGKRIATDSLEPLSAGDKTETYNDLCQELAAAGADVYVCRGYNNYLGQNRYRVNWQYQLGYFKLVDNVIEPTSVYDRSGRLFFPAPDCHNVLDSWEFKTIANNKWLAYLLFPQYFSKTHLITSPEELKMHALNLSPNDKFILKPVDGMKGRLVEMFDMDQLAEAAQILTHNPGRIFLMQGFIDTSKGIPGITKERHDLRVVCLNGKILWSHVRTPLAGAIKANVATGGDIREVELDKLPATIVSITQTIANKFASEFDNPFFSVDFGIDKDGKPYLFEINDTIGLPSPDMHGKQVVIDALAKRLLSF